MTKSSVTAVVLMIFAGFAFLFGLHSLMNAILVAELSAGSVVRPVVVLGVGVCLVVVGSKVWNRWRSALALVLLLIGFGGFQTRPAGATAPDARNARSAQVFRFSGGLIAVAGVVVYILARRRRP